MKPDFKMRAHYYDVVNIPECSPEYTKFTFVFYYCTPQKQYWHFYFSKAFKIMPTHYFLVCRVIYVKGRDHCC